MRSKRNAEKIEDLAKAVSLLQRRTDKMRECIEEGHAPVVQGWNCTQSGVETECKRCGYKSYSADLALIEAAKKCGVI